MISEESIRSHSIRLDNLFQPALQLAVGFLLPPSKTKKILRIDRSPSGLSGALTERDHGEDSPKGKSLEPLLLSSLDIPARVSKLGGHANEPTKNNVEVAWELGR